MLISLNLDSNYSLEGISTKVVDLNDPTTF